MKYGVPCVPIFRPRGLITFMIGDKLVPGGAAAGTEFDSVNKTIVLVSEDKKRGVTPFCGGHPFCLWELCITP